MYKRRYKKGGIKKYQKGGGPEIDADGNIFMNQTTPIRQQTTSKVRKRLIEESPNLDKAKTIFNLSATEYNDQKSKRTVLNQKQKSGTSASTPSSDSGLNFGDYLDIGLSTAGATPGWGAPLDVINTVQNLFQAAGNTLVGDYDEAWYDLKSAGTAALAIIPATQGITPMAKGIQVKSKVDKYKKTAKIVNAGGRANTSTGGGMSITRGYKTIAESGSGGGSLLTKVHRIGTQGGRVSKDGVILHPKFGGKGISNTGPNFKTVPSATMGSKIASAGKSAVDAVRNFNLKDLKKPIIEWKGPSGPFPINLTGRGAWWGPNAFWRTNVQRTITPQDVIINAGVYKAFGIIEDRMEDDILKQINIQEDIESQKEAFTSDSTDYQNENIVPVIPGWDANISVGANLFNTVAGNPPQMAKVVTDLGGNLDDFSNAADVYNFFIKVYPDTLGSIEEAAQFYDSPKDQKQMGGSYMGVPQQKPVGDEGGYMGQMQQFQMGGQNLPGGNMSNIPGSDAVQFNGQTHDEGGIMLDPKTEVEDGETMDKVNMAKGGGPKDYFFSSYLKKGGMSYADHHKNILSKGGDQKEIDILAKMQEKSAGRNPNAVQTAEQGGYRKYANGGPEQSVYGPNHGAYERALATSGYTGYGEDGTVAGADVGDEGYESMQGKNKQMVSGNLTHTGYFGEIGPAEREDFFNRNKDIMEKIGVDTWEDFDPLTHTDKFQNEFNAYLSDEYNNNEEFRNNLKTEGIENLEGLITTAGFHDKGHKSKRLDGNYGSYTHGKTSFFNKPDEKEDPETCQCENATTKAMIDYPCDGPLPPECKEGDLDIDKGCPCGTDPETYSEECCKEDSSSTTNRTLVGAAQLLPAAYAFAEGPDYMSEHKMASPGAIIPERLAKTHLERVDMNSDRARNQADYQSMNKFVDNAGLGSSGLAAKMAAYTRKQAGNREITAQETKANIEIGNQEALADQTRKTTNVANALDASKFNVTSQLEANKQNAIMEGTVDEFNRASDSAVKDRRLMALDSATKTMAGMYTDQKKIEAQERMADAVSGQTGVAERNRYSMQLLNSGRYKGTSDPKYIEAMEAYNKMNAPKQMRYGGYKRRY